MWIKVTLFVIAIPLAAGAYWVASNLLFLETADYRVVFKDGSYEVRDYPELAVASAATGLEGDDRAFGKLFRFIQGGNSQQQKIPMTTPVFIDSNRMRFVMPDEIAREGIPSPNVEEVSIEMRPAVRVAVFRFSGVADASVRNKALRSLTSWMERHGMMTEGEPIFAYYNPPFIPGPLRTNEVMFQFQ
jgi:hypothetical protein